MPDFEDLVRRQLGSLGLPPYCEREVVAELAAHLEDHYERKLAEGSGDSAALSEALRSLGNLGALRRRVLREKEDDVIAKHKIIGPGMVAMLLSGFTQWLVYISMSHYTTVYWFGDTSMTVEFPWIISLLAVGAFAAWLGRRVGATPLHRAVAATFPALLYAALFVFAFIMDMSFVHNVAHLRSFALWMIGWGLLPAAAGVIGALPFLRGESRQQPKSPTATAATA